MPKKRILTGLQPTGDLHLGNYFGSVQQMVDLQDTGELYFFIADLHALTNISNEQAQQGREGRKKNTPASCLRRVLH